jgi:beta-lactamase superfamily II metal-dependent hydrolase
MKRVLIAFTASVVLTAALVAQRGPTAARPLDIYVVDVEGGKANIVVGPGGQTMLIDTGFANSVDRIVEVAGVAGVTRFDYLLTTHYHLDHVGGLQELVKRIPVTTFLDHGPSAEANEQVQGFQAAYAALKAAAKHQVLKVGDTIPLPGVNWRIVTSGGEVLKTAIAGAPGAGPNSRCAGITRSTMNNGGEDNDHSVGSLVTVGAFRMIDFGDLTGAKEFDLVCPNNPIGTVDLFMASNHGTNNANLPFFVNSIAPRVSIAQNGATKGGSAQYLQALYTSPNFVDVWMTHWANAGIAECNPPGLFIANGMDPAVIAGILTAPPRAAGPGRAGAAVAAPATLCAAPPPPAAPEAVAPAGAPAATASGPQATGAPGAGGPGRAGGGRGGGGRGGQAPHVPAHYLKVSVQADGTFTITNSRNNFSKTYAPRAAR